MRGSLTWMPVCDLLRFGLRDDCAGTIELWRHDGRTGRIVFSHGWVLEAGSPSIGDGSDRTTVLAAVTELLAWRDGQFEVTLSSGDPARGMTLELELARLLREAIARTEAASFGARETWL